MEKELRPLTEEEKEDLKAVLERHKEWLESGGETGARADLRRTNLREADLREADLREAYLRGAYLRGADLIEADLRRANLRRANLSLANLSRANLSLANLSRADLSGADLREANLRGVDLREANLRGVDLSGAALRWADLSGTYLSGAKVDEGTLRSAQGLKGARVSVNGIWVEESDTAALMPMTPPGDSMQGANADAVVESLKHARRLHTFSFVLVLLGLVIIYLGLEEVQIPFFSKLMVPAEEFALIAMTFSTGFLTLVGAFMKDALSGARYLQTRRDAQTVGTFPWALSRYTRRRSKPQIETLFTRTERAAHTIQSYAIRLVMAFHPVAYLFLWNWGGSVPWYYLVPWYYWVLGLLLLGFCTRIFEVSEQFQMPIVFDSPTERERKSDLEELTLVVESLDDKLGTLLDERSAK